MPSIPIRIECIAVKDLESLARRAAADPAFAETAPISILRAASQAENPQAAPEDPALVLAMAGGRCLGYHGLLPGLIDTAAGCFKVAWLVTFYVAPAYRSRGIGRALVEAIKDLGLDLVTTGITSGAEKTYRDAGFRDLGELAYWQLRTDGIPRLALPAFYAALLFSRPVQTGGRWVCRPAARMPAGFPRLWAGPPHRPRFHRSGATVDWIMARPWVVSQSEAAPDVGGYYFSRVRERFEFFPVAASGADGGVQGGFLISLSRHRRRTQIKVLDLFAVDPGLAAGACRFALKLALRHRAERVDFPVNVFRRGEKASSWAERFVKTRRRLYLFHPQSAESPLARHAAAVVLDYCDSDTAFT